MSRPEAIALRVGNARWLVMVQQLVSLLGLVGILFSGASIAWVVATVCAWCATQVALRRAMRKSPEVSALMLRKDGSVAITSSTGTAEALPGAGCWVSRWLTVLSLERLDNGGRFHLLVCRSRNDADAYRHLVTQLRLGGSDHLRDAVSQR